MSFSGTFHPQLCFASLYSSPSNLLVQTAGCSRRQEQDEMMIGCCQVGAAVARELLIRRREKNVIKGEVPSTDRFMSLCHAPVPIKSLIRED
jgi:hypothetical protein